MVGRDGVVDTGNRKSHVFTILPVSLMFVRLYGLVRNVFITLDLPC